MNHNPRNIMRETVDAATGSPKTYILKVPAININNNTDFGCTIYMYMYTKSIQIIYTVYIQ